MLYYSYSTSFNQIEEEGGSTLMNKKTNYKQLKNNQKRIDNLVDKTIILIIKKVLETLFDD